MADKALMTASETKLLPCPLCHSTNIAEGVCYVEFKPNEPAVRCCDCGCRATLKAWNARAALTAALSDQAETIRACARSTMVGFQVELGDRNIEFICDQIARKATMGSDQASGWQDISTAPKDGGYVDLWFDKNEFDKGEMGDCYGRIPDCRWLAAETMPGWYAEHTENGPYYIGDGATHWSYRPAAPPPSPTAGKDKS